MKEMCTREENSPRPKNNLDEMRKSSPPEKLRKVLSKAVHPEQDDSDHIPYTPMQEFLNCVSMMGPSILCLWFINYQFSTITWNTWILMTGTFVHLPFSVIYHGLCAWGNDSEFWKRADITFIHVTSCFYAYALSSSQLYLSANMIANTRSVYTIWSKTGRHKAERSKNIMLSVILYLLPVLVAGDWRNFIGALSWFLLGGICFQINFLGGYGHSIFHTIFVVFQYYLLQASQVAGMNPLCL